MLIGSECNILLLSREFLLVWEMGKTRILPGDQDLDIIPQFIYYCSPQYVIITIS